MQLMTLVSSENLVTERTLQGNSGAECHCGGERAGSADLGSVCQEVHGPAAQRKMKCNSQSFMRSLRGCSQWTLHADVSLVQMGEDRVHCENYPIICLVWSGPGDLYAFTFLKDLHTWLLVSEVSSFLEETLAWRGVGVQLFSEHRTLWN